MVNFFDLLKYFLRLYSQDCLKYSLANDLFYSTPSHYT